jgi:hypothetical protein
MVLLVPSVKPAIIPHVVRGTVIAEGPVYFGSLIIIEDGDSHNRINSFW